MFASPNAIISGGIRLMTLRGEGRRRQVVQHHPFGHDGQRRSRRGRELGECRVDRRALPDRPARGLSGCGRRLPRLAPASWPGIACSRSQDRARWPREPYQSAIARNVRAAPAPFQRSIACGTSQAISHDHHDDRRQREVETILHDRARSAPSSRAARARTRTRSRASRSRIAWLAILARAPETGRCSTMSTLA